MQRTVANELANKDRIEQRFAALNAIADARSYGTRWVVQTTLGDLEMSTDGDYVHTCFQNVEKAISNVGGNLNRFSGKWNWYEPNLAGFWRELERIALPAPALLENSEQCSESAEADLAPRG
jgi:hypothetical protein